MLLCDVVARVWPEKQLEGLAGQPLVLVREVDGGASRVALDLVGAGVGVRVIVVTGEPAHRLAGGPPVDAVVTAIVNADTAKK